MQFTDKRNLWRWIIIALSFLIVTLIVINTYFLFQNIKREERIKIELWALSMKTVNNAGELDDLTIPSQVLSNNTTIPIIQTDKNNIINTANIPDHIATDTVKMLDLMEKMRKENEPIRLEYLPGQYQYVFYGNSSLLNTLIYYPLALILIIFLFGLMVYNFYRSTKISTQNKLWAGMAKETAHQIGTPLSSLIGWIEIMKADNVDETTVTEIEKDVVRLQTIADRFSKIGSEPVLEQRDLIEETRLSYDYLQSRFNHINFSFIVPQKPIYIDLNPVLHSWTIENLVKNAIDAMKGRGQIVIKIEQDSRFVRIQIKDTGKGIPKNQHKKIFEPGFTTKKRGWGLGLSLTKRIVESYHKGKIKVLHSEINKGTTIQVSFRKKTSE